jgi:hypothetical protein
MWAFRYQPVAIRSQAVDSGASKASTVWRQLATATGGYVRPASNSAVQCVANLPYTPPVAFSQLSLGVREQPGC